MKRKEKKRKITVKKKNKQTLKCDQNFKKMVGVFLPFFLLGIELD